MSRTGSVNTIRLRGVRQNNLKGFDLDIPTGRLVVVTGPSGSGKSSLAFDTLYAEGQRRYIETFSPYARQFFDRMDKPRVDGIENIPPAVAIEQRNAVRSTRSTVGTMTEVCDHMKALWPHIAQLHCRQCGHPVHREPPQTVWKTLNAEVGLPDATCLVTFDLPLSEKLSLEESFALIAKQGYQRLLIDRQVLRLDDPALRSGFRTPPAALTVVQDRVRLAPTNRARFIEACEQAYHFGKGKLRIHPDPGSGPDPAVRAPRSFSAGLHCARCDRHYPDPSPALFSFNHPVGACPACKGFGRIITIDYRLAIPDRRRTLKEGAVRPWQSGMSAECQRDLLKFCRASGVPVDVPFEALSPEHQDWIVQGDPEYGTDEEHEWPRAWYGVKGYFRWLESKAYKMHVRVLLSRYRAYTRCPECHGARLNPDALLYRFHWNSQPLTLADFYRLPIHQSLRVIEDLAPAAAAGSAFPVPRSAIDCALGEVRSRLACLNDIGLGYLTLDRATRTLSGGETERVNLAACLGTQLVNTLFVLDEPSVGLHPRDTRRLIAILAALRDAGNTVVVVEHEREVMQAADQIIDLGPGQGAAGGELVFQGTLARLLKAGQSLTGGYLSGRRTIPIPPRRPVSSPIPEPNQKSRIVTQKSLRLARVHRHNLKDLSVDIPLNRFVCISGVSGSGKSTLIREVLLPALQEALRAVPDPSKASDRMEEPGAAVPDDDAPSPEATLTGAEALSDVVFVDQSILAKTPRSNPAVYTGAFDSIRELFADTEAARQQGLKASAFSFNAAQGQCERCRGAGYEKVEMQFLSDVYIRCPDCNGRRYREHILEVRIRSGEAREGNLDQNRDRGGVGLGEVDRSLSIADLLESTVDEAIAFLEGMGESKPARKAAAGLRLLQEVGLGYLQLGQPINTLSGGESQRLKLVRYLAPTVAAVYDRRTAGPDPGPSATPGPANVDPTSQGAPRRLQRGGILFLLDEPTTGLHFDDVRVLLNALQRLVAAGHSLVVIEHNLEVLKCADWIIDLGPEAGEGGGELVVAGTPETVGRCQASHTGRFLRPLLELSRPGGNPGSAQTRSRTRRTAARRK